MGAPVSMAAGTVEEAIAFDQVDMLAKKLECVIN